MRFEYEQARAQRALVLPRRRLLLGGGLLALTGAGSAMALASPARRKRWLDGVSNFNDLAQAALFDPSQRAPTHDAAAITNPFPFNGFYPESMAPEVDVATWRLTLSGRVASTAPWDLRSLMQLEHASQITRLICIEGWSAVGQWAGVPLASFLASVGADLSTKYVAFRCADDYWTSIDMASALHPQTLLATHFLGQPLTASFGAPLRVRLPIKLGFKNAKHVTELSVTNEFVSGYWEQQGYNWFAGL
jgi:DMSO/TMAO reductase YedYZ molybdopterin-dependent catalytic subunit